VLGGSERGEDRDGSHLLRRHHGRASPPRERTVATL
jgi:hypothetical protein